MEPQKPPPDDADFLPLTATPKEEEAHRETLDGKKKLATENIRIRLRAKKAEAEIVELKQKLAESSVDPKTAEKLAALRHERAIREMLDGLDFFTPGARAKLVAELQNMTRLDGDALTLLDEDGGDDLPLNAEELRKLLPPEQVLARTGGGSGARRPLEAAGPPPPRGDDDSSLIEKGNRSQAFYDAHKAEIVAAERRRGR